MKKAAVSGLSLVKEYVRLLGGDIAVQSKPGEGSEFTLTLPVSRNAAQKDIPTSNMEYLNERGYPGPEESPEALSHPQLLIIEDNPEVMDFLRILLEKKYGLHFAPTGKQGSALRWNIYPT